MEVLMGFRHSRTVSSGFVLIEVALVVAALVSGCSGGGDTGSGGNGITTDPTAGSGGEGSAGTSAAVAGTGGQSLGSANAGSGGGPDAPAADGGVMGNQDGGLGPWDLGTAIPAQSQEPGDAQAGYQYLTNAGYFGCGVPARFFGLVRPFATLPGIPNEPLAGRSVSVDNQPLGYNWNLAKNSDGIDVVYMNCLQCHAGKFNGKLLIGLGNADADWTQNLGGAAGASNLLGALLPTPQEQKELDKFIGRLKVIGDPAVMKTVGTNPAEMLATTFVAHRDRATLAWSDTALLHISALDTAPKGTIITSKTPPWWRMAKKNAQFYNGMGRGDHRRSEMLAGSLCTDTVDQANAIDAHFKDVSAYIRTVKAPSYPFAIDHALADKGKAVFNDSCAGCHGTYASEASNDAGDTYPNLFIPQAEIQTDPAVGLGGTTVEYGSALVDWYNQSWYGEVGHYEPASGYVAPPLDGVWATAPYLHNGSVPDIATLLDSTKRPKYWRRMDHDTTHYDERGLGFPWMELTSGQAAPPLGVAARDIYDSTQYSHGNGGHTYGDSLSGDQRAAVLEYLKTL
jgi:cytochrome c5